MVNAFLDMIKRQGKQIKKQEKKKNKIKRHQETVQKRKLISTKSGKEVYGACEKECPNCKRILKSNQNYEMHLFKCVKD